MVLVFLQIDEFQAAEKLQDIFSTFGKLFSYFATSSLNLQLFPIFTGTATSLFLENISFSQLQKKRIFINRLSLDQSIEAVRTAIINQELEFAPEILNEKLVIELIHQLGGVPRYCEYFLKEVASLHQKNLGLNSLNAILENIV